MVVVGVDASPARSAAGGVDAQPVGPLFHRRRRACAARWPSRRCGRSPSRASCRCRCSVRRARRANSAMIAERHRGIGNRGAVDRAAARAARPRGPRSSRRRMRTSAPCRASTSANATSPWIESRPTPVTRTGPAAEHAGGEEIRRARGIAFDVQRPGARVAARRPAPRTSRAPSLATSTPKRRIRLSVIVDVGPRDELALAPSRSPARPRSGSACSRPVRNWLDTSPRIGTGARARCARGAIASGGKPSVLS